MLLARLVHTSPQQEWRSLHTCGPWPYRWYRRPAPLTLVGVVSYRHEAILTQLLSVRLLAMYM